MKTISIANQKGGCGKTTTAINLSSAIAVSGKRVLLIDLDPQSHATFGLGITSQSADKSVYNILTENSDRSRPISECIVKVSKDLDMVPSSILLSTIEQELKDKEDAVSKLYDILVSANLSYDYIVIDCPPSLGFLTFNALRAADIVLVPIDMSAFSLMGVAKLLGMLELIKVKISHSPRVNAVATIFDRRTKYSQTILEDIRSLFKEQMLNTTIRLNVALKKAASQGISVIEYDRASNGAVDHIALAREILKNDRKELEMKETAKESVIADEIAKAIESEEAKALKELEETIQQPINPEKSIMIITDGAGNVRRSSTDFSDRNISGMLDSVESLSKEVSFAIEAPNAKDIYIVGDFNEWKMDDSSRLTRSLDGRWEKKMGLSSGRYKYKFIVDGEWVLDSNNAQSAPNGFGTLDSILELI